MYSWKWYQEIPKHWAPDIIEETLHYGIKDYWNGFFYEFRMQMKLNSSDKIAVLRICTKI